MSWFSNLFKWPEEHPASKPDNVPVFTTAKVDISEPVISFVETFKANPGRFSITLDQDTVFYKKGQKFTIYSYGNEDNLRLKLVDKKEKLEWSFALRTSHCFIVSKYIPHPLWSYPKFLSEDEAHFIFAEIQNVYEERAKRLKGIFDTKEREALKKVYCK